MQHKITSNRLRPYGIDYFSIGLTTNSSMSRSTWKGQAQSLAQPQKADEESCASIAMPSGFTKTPANGQRSVDGKIKRDPRVLEEFCGLSWSKTLSFHLSLWSPSLWIWSSTEAASNPCRYELSEISNQLEEWGRSTDTWHRNYFGQIMIVLMCHGITLYPSWLHVCQGTELKYTCQHEHIDTGSGVGKWPSTGVCHRPRVGEYCASIGMPPPFRMVLTIFPSVWPPIHQCQDQHGKVKLQGIRRNTDPVVQHAVWFGDDATIISQPSLPRKLWKLGFYDSFMVWSIGRSKAILCLIFFQRPNLVLKSSKRGFDAYN